MSEVIDYNVPLTTTYMKQMKLQSISSTKVRDSGVFACVRGDVTEELWEVEHPSLRRNTPPVCTISRLISSPAVLVFSGYITSCGSVSFLSVCVTPSLLLFPLRMSTFTPTFEAAVETETFSHG